MHWGTNLLASALLLNGLLGALRPGLADSVETHALNERDCDHDNRTIPNGQRPGWNDVRLDAYCASVVLGRVAPRGMVTVFGSSRLGAGTPAYELTREFARKWTAQQGVKGRKWPIATGGGKGLMEAANRGALEAHGMSIGLATHFGPPDAPPSHNPYTTKGATYVFSSYSQRETEMVDRASAVVIGPGGIGTEWEIMETLSKLQTNKIDRLPLILLGPTAQWKSLLVRLSEFVAKGTIDRDNLKLLNVAETADQAIQLILASPAEREKTSVFFPATK